MAKAAINLKTGITTKENLSMERGKVMEYTITVMVAFSTVTGIIVNVKDKVLKQRKMELVKVVFGMMKIS